MKSQFDNSPDFDSEIMNAIIEAFDAHTEMSSQAVNSRAVFEGLKEILTGPSRLYELLNEQNSAS